MCILCWKFVGKCLPGFKGQPCENKIDEKYCENQPCSSIDIVLLHCVQLVCRVCPVCPIPKHWALIINHIQKQQIFITHP